MDVDFIQFGGGGGGGSAEPKIKTNLFRYENQIFVLRNIMMISGIYGDGSGRVNGRYFQIKMINGEDYNIYGISEKATVEFLRKNLIDSLENL